MVNRLTNLFRDHDDNESDVVARIIAEATSEGFEVVSPEVGLSDFQPDLVLKREHDKKVLVVEVTDQAYTTDVDRLNGFVRRAVKTYPEVYGDHPKSVLASKGIVPAFVAEAAKSSNIRVVTWSHASDITSGLWL